MPKWILPTLLQTKRTPNNISILIITLSTKTLFTIHLIKLPILPELNKHHPKIPVLKENTQTNKKKHWPIQSKDKNRFLPISTNSGRQAPESKNSTTFLTKKSKTMNFKNRQDLEDETLIYPKSQRKKQSVKKPNLNL